MCCEWAHSAALKYDGVYYNIMVNEFEAESNIKNDTEENLEDVGDKIKAGAKAVANKIKDPSKDLL